MGRCWVWGGVGLGRCWVWGDVGLGRCWVWGDVGLGRCWGWGGAGWGGAGLEVLVRHLKKPLVSAGSPLPLAVVL